MTLKIRKLYNVLVVGGMAAAGLSACEKTPQSDTDLKRSTSASGQDVPVAAPAAPLPAPLVVETLPAKQPDASAPAAVAPAAVAPELTAKVGETKVTAKDAARASAKAARESAKVKKVAAKKGDDPGGGATGWS
jgi:hypothetical protein